MNNADLAAECNTVTSNEGYCISIHRQLDCLINSLFRLTAKVTLILTSLALCDGNTLVADGFRSQRANDVESVSMWWQRPLYDNADGFRQWHTPNFVSGDMESWPSFLHNFYAVIWNRPSANLQIDKTSFWCVPQYDVTTCNHFPYYWHFVGESLVMVGFPSKSVSNTEL